MGPHPFHNSNHKNLFNEIKCFDIPSQYKELGSWNMICILMGVCNSFLVIMKKCKSLARFKGLTLKVMTFLYISPGHIKQNSKKVLNCIYIFSIIRMNHYILFEMDDMCWHNTMHSYHRHISLPLLGHQKLEK